MKKIFLIISAAVFLLAGCQKEQLVDNRAYNGPVTVVGATFEKFSEDEATKASVTDAGNFSWQVDDQAAFTESSSTAYCLGTNAVEGLNAQFGIEGTHTFSSSSWALYPYDLTTGQSPATLKVKVPASREWKERQTNVAMYGVKKTSTPVFDFSHMGGLVRVRVNNVPTNAREFVFKATGCKINGEFAVTENGGKKIISTGEPATGEDTYTLTWTSAPEVENHMDFYIPLPVGSYNGGFAFYLKDGEHNILYKKVGTTPQTVARRQLLLMPPITLMGGAIETAEKAAVAVEIPAGYSGDYLLPQTEKVLLKINASSGDHDITLKYDGVELPTYLEIKVIGDDENYNAILAGNLPQTHVEFTSGHIDNTSLTTSSSTLAVINPATVGTLTVKGGNVLLKGAAVTSIVVDETAVASEETQAPVQIVMEKQGDNAPAVTEKITAKANVVVAPAENVTVTVTVPEAAQEQVQVANGGAGTVQDESGNEIETKATAKIGDIKYITLADAIAAVQNGQIITMIADVTDANGISVPVGNKTFTVDFNGHTYTCLDNPTGSTNTTNQVFQLNAGNTITFKNGTIKVAETNKIKFRFIIQNYADLTLEGMTLDGTNLGINNSRYTLSNNAGNINLTGNTTIKAAAENGVAFDIYHWEAYYPQAPILTWNSTGSVDGIIELSGGKFVVAKNLSVSVPVMAAEGESTLEIGEGATLSSSANFNDPNPNLNNHKSTAPVQVKQGAGLTICGDGTVEGINNAYSAVIVSINGDNDSKTAKLTVGGNVTLKGEYYGICGNGSRHNTEIIVNGGTIKGVDTETNLGIYHPQNGKLTITGGTIVGFDSAVEVRGGTVNISGGSLTASATEFECNANGSGSTTVGAALAIAQHNTKKDIKVTVTGGTFTGVKALNESNPQENDPAPQVDLSVSGGTFNGEISTTDVIGFIKGGTFSSKPADDLLASGYAATENGGVWTVAKIVAAKIGETTYSTLKAALDAAVNNDVIVLCMDIIRENVSDNSDRETYDVSGKTITLDLNGHTIKHRYGLNKKGVFEVKNATLTIDDSSIEKNGKIADTYAQAVLSAENSVVNLKNGILAAEYSSTSSTNYRVVKLKNTTFTMDGGSVLAATTGSYNRAFEFVHSTGTNSKVIVNNGIIKTFTSYAVVFYGDSGGYQGENNTVEINGGEISTQGNYGWLGDDMFGEITMNGGSFTSNWHQVVDTNTTFTHNGGTVNIKSN